jgi:hypothetical protein
MYSPKSIIFLEGNAQGEYDTRGWINFLIIQGPDCSYFCDKYEILYELVYPVYDGGEDLCKLE